MPPVETADTFLDLLGRSGLLRPDLIDPLRGYDPPGPEGKSLPQRLAAHLVRERLLTATQANHLLRGQFRGFFISNKYKILDRLGTGGMGTVFLCEHLLLQRLVAVKVLTGTTDRPVETEGIVQRFYREARAVAALDHPNIVRVFDVDSVGGQPFMVMEYVDGTDLHRVTTTQGKLGVAQAAGYARQAALGLQHAHEAGLVHRDIKPGNILVDRAGGVKILDLGLVRFHTDVQRNENLTERYDDSAIMGTADFISPEQVHRSKEVDIRSDLYSLGCTLYFLLTGRSVFADGSATQKLIWHQNRTAPPVTAARPDVPSVLAGVITRLLAKQPEDRYQTPAEVAVALTPFADEQITPPPPGLMPKAPASSFRLGLCRIPPPGSSFHLTPRTPARPAGSSSGAGTKTAGDAATPSLRSHAPTQRMSDIPLPQPTTGIGSRALAGDALYERPGAVRRRALIITVGTLTAVLIGVVAYRAARPDVQEPIPGVQPTQTPAVNAGPASPVPSTGVPPVTQTMTAGGSTFVAPLMSYWTDRYRQARGVHTAYKALGSGKGLEGVRDGSLAFGCTDAPMTDGEIKKLRDEGREVLHIPLVMGAVVPTYNLPGVTKRLRFTGGLLADIYLGKVTRWNDPVIQANNPGVELPDREIQVLYRSDSSGTTFIWTDYLSKVSGAWAEKKIGPATKVTWPAGVGRGAEKSDGIAEVVTRTVGAIGYVELSHAIANSLPFGEVRNKMGKYITPSLESVTAAAAGTIPEIRAEEFRLQLTDAPGEKSYPISGMTWAVLVFPAHAKPAPAVVDFLEWATHEGQSHVSGLRYAPLPETLKVRLDATFYRLKRTP